MVDIPNDALVWTENHVTDINISNKDTYSATIFTHTYQKNDIDSVRVTQTSAKSVLGETLTKNLTGSSNQVQDFRTASVRLDFTVPSSITTATDIPITYKVERGKLTDYEKGTYTWYNIGTYTVTIHVTPVSYTIIFDNNDGRIQTITTTDTYTVPQPYTREHEIFVGWYWTGDESYTTLVQPGEVLHAQGNESYLAGWYPEPKYTVRFILDDGTVHRSYTQYASTKVFAPSKPDQYTELEFVGWGTSLKRADDAYTPQYISNIGITVTGNLDLYVQLRNTYTISFKDGSYTSTRTNYKGATVQTPTISTVSERDAFLGWKTPEGIYYGEGVYITVPGNVTYLAEYRIRATVTYKWMRSPDTTESLFVDDVITLPKAATDGKFVHINWVSGSSTYQIGSSYKITGDVVFTAVWEEASNVSELPAGYVMYVRKNGQWVEYEPRLGYSNTVVERL